MDRAADAEMLAKELEWLSLVLDFRFNSYFENKTTQSSLAEIFPPNLVPRAYYSQIVDEFEMQVEERLLLILALNYQL